MQKKFISDLNFLKMKHFIVGIELHRWLFPHNFASEVVNKIFNYIIMNLANSERN